MEIFPKDVLLRIGGRTWQRYGRLAVAGAGRHVTPVPITFTRADGSTSATLHDRSGVVRLASANRVRVHYPGTLGLDGGLQAGLRMESTRTNIIKGSQDLGNATHWSALNGATVTPAALTLGKLVMDLVTDNSASNAYVQQAGAAVFTPVAGATALAFSVYAKKGTSTLSQVEIFNNADLTRHGKVDIPWNTDGTPGTPTALVNAVFLGTDPVAQGAYRFRIRATTVDVADTHIVRLFPVAETQGAAATGTCYFGGIQVENAPYPSTYIPTTTVAVARAADQLTVPLALDMASDWSILLWFLSSHGNLASWAETEPETDPLMVGLFPTVAASDADNTGIIVLHRQNTATQYEWEYLVNRGTAARPFSVTAAAQKLVLRHHATDHHVSAAIDGGAFVDGAVPTTVTIPAAQVLFRLRNLGDWSLFDAILARGLHTQAELDAIL